MTNYLNSANVKVYPSAYRGVDEANNLYDPEARIPSEKNVTSQLASITPKSFIVYPTIEEAILKNDVRSSYIPGVFKFCIHGYLFEVTLDSWLGNVGSATEIWACIKTANANKDYDGSATDYAATSLVDLDGDTTSNITLDSANTFKGIKFVTGSEAAGMTGNGIYKLLVFKKVEDKWLLPIESYIKFSTAEIYSVVGTTVDSRSINEFFNTKSISANDITSNIITCTETITATNVSTNSLTASNHTELADTTISLLPSQKVEVKFGNQDPIANIKAEYNEQKGIISLSNCEVSSDAKIEAAEVYSTIHTTEGSSDYVCTTKAFTEGRYVKDLVFSSNAGKNPSLKSKTATGTETTVITEDNFKQMFLEMTCPIGTIYTSDRMIDGKCPIEVTLGGTWERMQGKYLYPVADGGANTEYGSNAAYIVPHDHSMTQVTRTASFASRPAGNDKANILSTNSTVVTQDPNFKFTLASSSTNGDVPFAHGLNMRSINDNKYWLMTLTDTHVHTMTDLTNDNIPLEARLLTPSDIQTANMPASIGVYVWKRIA